MLAAANWIQSMRQRAMAAYAKIFSDLVTSNADTVATWQIGSGSPKVRFRPKAVIDLDQFEHQSALPQMVLVA